MAGTAKKTDLGLLEEDDEFEEFPAEGMSFLFLSESSSWKYHTGLDNLFYKSYILRNIVAETVTCLLSYEFN